MAAKTIVEKYVMNMLTITLKYEFFILLMVVQGKHGIKG